MCSDVLSQAEPLQWHKDLAGLLALALDLTHDLLMPDLSPPNARGVLLVLGRAPRPVGAGDCADPLLSVSPAQPCSHLCDCLHVGEIKARAVPDPPGLCRQLPAAFCPSCLLC